MFTYEACLPMIDRAVEGLLVRQVMDKSDSRYGGFIAEGLDGGSGVSSLTTYGFGYLLDGSGHQGSDELVDRIRLGAQWSRTIRRPSGCYDLVTTNFDSSPDTGFIVNALSPVVKAARIAAAKGDSGAQVIADEIGEIIQAATPGMVAGGFHTPNHRWVLVSALSQAYDLFPELEGKEIIDQYLNETIDINADGEYTERSTGVYNAICNRFLRIAADRLDRPDLLDAVRKNLTLSYHLLHADGSVVTSISSRQDRGQKTIPIGLVDSYYALARQDDNGFFAACADWLWDLNPSGGTWAIHPFLEHPEWREDNLEREPLPDSYAKVYPVSGMWRVRRGKASATSAKGITAPFSLTYGNVELTAVKVCASYFAVAQFNAAEMSGDEKGVTLHDPGRGSVHESPGYYQPIGTSVTSQEWGAVRRTRDHYDLPPFDVEMKIEEVEGGFDLTARTSEEGLDKVPFQIAFDFVPGGELDLDSGAVQGRAGEIALLKLGHAVYHIGDDAISIGPGVYGHRMWSMRGSESTSQLFRVLLTAVTPVDQKVEIRYGTWSTATESIV
ncbi:MAG: hypothetical protein VX910_00765 [Candidatus Latescibacterota bacterium]|nr:hypothetical protein [Candidatus Latescibacterota bacterium]